MAKFRKKPVVIEAVQVRDFFEKPVTQVPAWAGDAAVEGKLRFFREEQCVQVHTLEGVMEGSVDDWIIRGVKGELYPCKPDIFAATYEQADE
jgi:hypothetical protein